MEGQRDTRFQEAVLALKAPSATKALLIFDEVNALVEGNLLKTSPFDLAVFRDDLASGCRLMSGTPLHAFVRTLAAGYGQYVVETTPLNAVELDRWLSTPLGQAVMSKTTSVKRHGGLSKGDIAWTGGVPRSLAILGRAIQKGEWRNWGASQSGEAKEFTWRLDKFLAEMDERRIRILGEACEAMFLGGNKEVDFDVNMLSTSLFYGDASRCIPLNLVAERVLLKWWALAAKDEISHRIALAYKDLMHEKEETRGYALQTILRYSVLSKDSHAHVLPVHRAFGGQPKPGGWEQLQLACEDHVYEAWNALIKEGRGVPSWKKRIFQLLGARSARLRLRLLRRQRGRTQSLRFHRCNRLAPQKQATSSYLWRPE